MQYLETNGIYVEGYGTVKATIVCTTHDNLAAHMLYCRVLGFNAKYFCRFCKITLEDSMTTTTEQSELLRINVQEDIENALDVNGKITNLHKSYGVRGVSELQHLKYFQVETGSTVDPFHDLLEGVVPRDLKHVLLYMKRNMKINDNNINQYVHAYNFGILSNSHKPANLKLSKESNSLNLSGKQCETFLLNFPFIFGHLFKTPEELKVLNFVHNLITVTCIAFKKTLMENEVIKLEECIELHLTVLRSLFPEARFSRKHHFLTHYPRIIRNLGPTALMSTAPYENKHVFFTRHKCHKNIGN